MNDGVDVVVTLHALATYAENANHWTDDKRMMDASGVADTIYEAMDRIEELEAKLAKAELIVRIIASDKWNERLGEVVDLSCEYLAELTGGKEI